MKGRYNWSDTFKTFQRNDIKDLGKRFPKDFDTMFDDNQNNIKITKDMKYITIPISNFPVSHFTYKCQRF